MGLQIDKVKQRFIDSIILFTNYGSLIKEYVTLTLNFSSIYKIATRQFNENREMITQPVKSTQNAKHILHKKL